MQFKVQLLKLILILKKIINLKIDCDYKCGTCSKGGINTYTETCYSEAINDTFLEGYTTDVNEVYTTLLDA